MTKLALCRYLVPALVAIGGLGCTGSHEPIVSGQSERPAALPGSPPPEGRLWFVSGTGGLGRWSPFGSWLGGQSIMCSNTGGATFTGSGGVSGRGRTQFPPSLGTTYSQPAAPPAITGGTLLVLADGKTAVAADPDRDAIYVVDLPVPDRHADHQPRAG